MEEISLILLDVNRPMPRDDEGGSSIGGGSSSGGGGGEKSKKNKYIIYIFIFNFFV